VSSVSERRAPGLAQEIWCLIGLFAGRVPGIRAQYRELSRYCARFCL